jgi:PAS domain S-box-containing protein
MKGPPTRNQELIEEISALKKRIRELEQSEATYKQAEKAFRDSEERYINFIANASEGIFCIDMTPPVSIDMSYDLLSKQIGQCAVVVEANAALAAMYGLSREQMIGRPVVEFAPNCGVQMADLVKTEGYRITEREEIKVSAEGNPVYVIESYRGVVEDRMLKRIWGVQRDITDRKPAEEELGIIRNRLSRAEIISRSGNWEFDLKSKRVFASEGARKIYGLLNAEWTIPQVQKIPLPEYRTMLDKALQDLIREDRPYDLVFKIQRPGTGEIIDIHSVAEYDRRRDVVFGVIRDITELKQAEREIIEEREKLKILSDNAPFGMVLINKDGHFTYYNTKFSELFGFDLSLINDSRTWLKKAFPDNEYRHTVISTWIEDFRNVKPGEQKPRVFTVTCKDGTQKITNFIPSMLISGDYLMACEDITDLRHAESQLRQAQKIESIGTLAGGIAHDFNNILTALMGYATLMQMKMDKSSPLKSYLDQILSASQKAADLTRSLLAFSRQQPTILAPLDINNTIKVTEKLLKRLLTEDIELCTSFTHDDTVAIADRSQMDQILFNLVTNARDAMPGGGILKIETDIAFIDKRFIKVHGFGKSGQYVLINISDTGTGIDETTLEKIFDPFFTTKETGKGTGLGLATVYGIIKQHNGYITVDSKPGDGAIFHIYLPKANMKVNPEEDATAIITTGDETVLIAEDNEEVRYFMREALQQHGYKIIEASDGEDAIDKFKQHLNINLIIVDSVMPKKNGRAVYEEIHRIKPHIKVLFTSGYTDDIILDKGIENKEFDFIAKPLSLNNLLQKVREVLDRQ